MDSLFSPWRSAHVVRATEQQRAGGDAGGLGGEPSLFARIAAEPEHDRAHGVVWRGPACFAVLNRYPYTNGHLLLLPYREVSDYDALTAEERHELADLTARAVGWLRAALAPDGFNVGMNLGMAAGAGIPRHLHVHVVPRWHGDTNFLPVVGGAKVIPEDPDTTWQKLRAAAAAEGTEAVFPSHTSDAHADAERAGAAFPEPDAPA